jgi:hypothetical protein
MAMKAIAQVYSSPYSRALLLMAIASSFLGLVACGNSSSSSITVPPAANNALLHGQYAFTFSGQNVNNILAVVGSFTADGAGNITAGSEDINNGAGSVNLSFTGTYSVGSDKRGIAVINTSNGPATWQFTMVNSSHALLVRFDTFATASGSIDLQDSTAFSNSALNGNFVFNFAGLGLNGGNISQAGNWTMDGAGNIPSGFLDLNDTGAVLANTSLSGTYTISNTANGRGVASLTTSGFGTQSFVFYVVNNKDLKFLETDSLPVASGEVLQQVAGPFSNSTLTGHFVFTVGGETNTALPLAAGGLFTANGAGSLTSVILDDNNNGNVITNEQFTGTYSVNSSGRGSLTFGALQFAFYVAANGTVELVELDASGITSGFARFQAAGPFGMSSLAGNFALNLSGTNLSGLSEEDIGGVFSANGAGGLTGTLDINNSGSLLQGVALRNSNYTMAVNGRGAANLNSSPANFAVQIYQVDANTALFLETDNRRVITGIIQK